METELTTQAICIIVLMDNSKHTRQIEQKARENAGGGDIFSPNKSFQVVAANTQQKKPRLKKIDNKSFTS